MREDLADRASLLNAAFVQHCNAVADLLDDLHLVRDDDDGDVLGLVDRLQKREDRLCGHGVEGARRFVAEDDLRVVGEHACNCHTLLLAARELRGVGVRLIGNADELQDLHRALFCVLLAHADDLQREADVAEDSALHEKVEVLEDHADLLAAAADLRRGKRRHVLPMEKDLAGGRPFQKVQAAHERALARAGQADDAENIALFYVQRHVAQRLKVVLPVVEHLLNML